MKSEIVGINPAELSPPSAGPKVEAAVPPPPPPPEPPKVATPMIEPDSNKKVTMKWSKLDRKGFVMCIGFWLLSLIITIYVMMKITAQLQQVISLDLPKTFGRCVAVIAWLCLVIYTLDDCVLYVDYQKINLSMGARGNRTRRFLRSGLRFFVPFFEKLQTDPSDPKKIWEINLEDENIPIGEGKVRVFMTGDNLPIAVSYKGTLRPNDSSDEHLARYIVYDDGVIVKQFEALIDQNLSDLIAKRNQKDILADKKALITIVQDTFNTIGTGAVHLGLSDHFGVILDSLAIENIDLDPDVIEALKAEIKARGMLAALVAFRGSGVDANAALRAYLINEKKLVANETTVEYLGLDKLPQGLLTFAPGAGVGIIGGK